VRYQTLGALIMTEIFSTPDNAGPALASQATVRQPAYQQQQIANAEIAAALFVTILLVIFGLPRLWRRARVSLALPVEMPDPVRRPD
jgi:hypothetical protein